MLPANLAKGRAATRGLGELLMVSPAALQSFRYSPYTVPATNNNSPSSSSSSPTLYTQSLLQPQLHLLGLDPAQHHQHHQLALTHLLGGQLGSFNLDDLRNMNVYSELASFDNFSPVHNYFGLPVQVKI